MPERALVEKVIEAGRYAPSGGNNQTTHFIVFSNAEILSGMAGLVCKEFAEMEITESMYSSLKNSINAANPTVNKRKDMEVY
jgi:nitroreductase